jgi:hypothetical protein
LNEDDYIRVRSEILDFLMENAEQPWVKIFGGAGGAQRYVQQYQKEGTYAPASQLFLAAKRYNFNFILFEPEAPRRFQVYYADEVVLFLA